MNILDLEQENQIYTVSTFNNEVREVLEGTFETIWIEGEISNFAAPGSGHWYFSLKDDNAQVRCAMFRSSQRKANFTPKNGSQVLIRARVSLYEPRGEFQLIADFMEERGEGKLRRAFEALKKKLEAAGWFAEDIKKALPEFPKCIGIITSPTGAAIRDILTVLKRRYPCVPVIIYPTLVQGDTAAPAISAAIQLANQRQECDVLIVSRGGGSLEDLWPFNEEITAKAIFESVIPIISGVGHEIDFTIADFVADVRAPTPSAAAEIATPDKAEILAQLNRHAHHLIRCIKQRLSNQIEQLGWIHKHILQLHPSRKLNEKMQLLDHYESRLAGLMMQKIQQQRTRLASAASKLDGISPLATLQRGYSITTKQNGKLIHQSSQVKVGEMVKVCLQRGHLECEVAKIND